MKQKAHLFFKDKNLFPCETITFFHNSILFSNILGLIQSESMNENVAEGLFRGQQIFSNYGG
ncbi:MAG: hypothetical protein R2861_09195 [Desulfobacterales bacterium]